MDDTFDPGAFADDLGSMMGPMLIVGLVVYLYFAIVLTILAKKTRTPNAWLAWVPIGNLVLMCQIGRKSPAWVLALFVPLLNLVALVVVWSAIAQVCGKSQGLGCLMVIPPVNLLLPLYLALTATPSLGAPAGTVMMTPPPQPLTGGGGRSCPRCGAVAGEVDRFCGSCGFVLTPAQVQAPAAAAPRQSTPPPLPQEPPRPSPAREGAPAGAASATLPQPASSASGAKAVVGCVVIVAILVGAGFYFYQRRANAPAAPLPPIVRDSDSGGTPTVEKPVIPVTPGTPVTPAEPVESCWVEQNARDSKGRIGIVVRAKLTRPQESGSELDVRVAGSSGPIAATSVALGSGDASQPVVAFIAYDDLDLEPAVHDLRVTARVFDSKRGSVGEGRSASFQFEQKRWCATRVQVRPSAPGSSADRAGFTFSADVLCDPVPAAKLFLLIHFRDANGGQLLPGEKPYADDTGNLVVAREFRAPTSRDTVTGIELFLPYRSIPDDVADLLADVTLYDATSNRFLGDPFRLELTVPE